MKLLRVTIFRITSSLFFIFLPLLFVGSIFLPIFLFITKFPLLGFLGSISALVAVVYWLKYEEKLGNQKFGHLQRVGFAPLYRYKYYLSEAFCWRLFWIDIVIILGYFVG